MKSRYTLFTPGPIDVPDEVLRETSCPLVYHRENAFGELYNALTEDLKEILAAPNCDIFLFTSSGTGGMEAACANVLSRKDKPIVAISGKFGERWFELCTSYGIEPILVKAEYGKSIEPGQIEEALRKAPKSPVILTTLTETSTGALNDIKRFGEVARAFDACLVVDGVAGIGADYCPQDEWNVDVLVGASQKALMAPPGIAFVSMSKRALARAANSDLPKYYFNIETYRKFRDKNQTPFTPAITILCGMKKGLDMILEKGLQHNFQKHAEIAEYVRERVHSMGFELLPERPSNALTVAKMPPGKDSTPIIKEIKEQHKILFANGQANLRGTIIRIGHMGNYTVEKLSKALDILQAVACSDQK
ncbi:MAG: alanine--glyoxylate aminotransferase family protein [candidate division WOR-3 bacterium]|nr:MAG: alanine--glyoxylate aminotransferase family protein [candidate division WOR-3 bacterium]